jgi:hypothetical protein
MAKTQTIVMTVIPRGVAMNTDSLPVSVFVTPRLAGADKLGAFPDWLQWARRLKENGLTLTLRCGGNEQDVTVDPQALDPGLWESLFKEDTRVRSFEFDDYSGKPVMSYSVREALSVLKSMYQQAAISLALPEDSGKSQERGNRFVLRQLLDGLDVNWSSRDGEHWRDLLRKTQQQRRRGRLAATLQSPAQLDAEGLVAGTSSPAAKQSVAIPFSVFHHMPTPKSPDEKKPVPSLNPDWDTELDFHQALASLNAYASLQRALGIVFDFELPVDFVPLTPPGQYVTLSVSGVGAGWDWSIQPQTPELETACVHLALGATRLFLTAPRMLDDPTADVPPILGLLDLSPLRFGLAQVDVDGGMHKAIIQAETWFPQPGRNLDATVEPDAAAHPEVFDPEATLPALRSGGFSLYADERALQLLDLVAQSKAFNDALEEDGSQPRPFFAEDLVRGYRLDVWDSHTNDWHSLHFRDATYRVENGPTHASGVEEGFVQLAVMQPAPGAEPASDDLYLHEAVARWAGWSLAVEMPGLHVSSSADPAKALESESVNEAVTPFKLTTSFGVVEGTLPSLRFGRRYRLRARSVDLAGSGLEMGDTVADLLSILLALPREPEGFAYLRYEPVDAPLVVIRDESAVTGAGSAVDRLVIRTKNDNPAKDWDPADLAGSQRHVLPPRTSVELGERLGMFDTPTGKLHSDAATWNLIAKRDAAELNHVKLKIAGHEEEDYPLEPGESVTLPYLPDLFSRGAAIRDLPATPTGAIGRAAATGAVDKVAYDQLSDPNPRPGSATLISFRDDGDWKGMQGFRLVLGEPVAGDDDPRPSWDPVSRMLTVLLPKGEMTTVPLSSYLLVDDLKLMGQWQWLRQFVELLTVVDPDRARLIPGTDVDRIAHVLQRAVEGGHWLLTPPRLLTLVHAVQQPIGRPEFAALDVEHDPEKGFDPDSLQTKPISGRPDPTELAPITAWRRPGSTDAYLMGALRVHGASTVRVDISATWDDVFDDPVDDPKHEKSRVKVHCEAQVDTLPLPDLRERELTASGTDFRRVGHYDPENDQIAFVRAGDTMGGPDLPYVFPDAAPRHAIGDTKHHRVTYEARSTSRFREYFPQKDENDKDLDFTRQSDAVVIDVPASERPLAPGIVYVVPTFGWQRQTETNLMRSVRFGGGLRVYLERPWFSSGDGELLGVALWNTAYGTLDKAGRDKFKPFITQWGMDPIWKTASILPVPMIHNFPDAIAFDRKVTLEERTARTEDGAPGLVDVVGFEPQFDKERGLWFADLTVEPFGETYMPFVRLALVRYQPDALLDAKVSRVVIADFAQLTPDRSAMVTCDPHHPRRVNVVVSGVAPTGPPPGHGGRPTQITVRVQERDPQLPGDLGWRDTAEETATVTAAIDGPAAGRPNIVMWAGSVVFTESPEADRFRLLVEEHEFIAPGETIITGSRESPRGRLVYAETFALDTALLASA